jgi:hypothetical protein
MAAERRNRSGCVEQYALMMMQNNYLLPVLPHL